MKQQTIDIATAKLKYETYLFSRLFIDIDSIIETRDMTFNEFCKKHCPNCGQMLDWSEKE